MAPFAGESGETTEVSALVKETNGVRKDRGGRPSVFEPFPELEKESSFDNKTWFCILGISAFLDFLAKVVGDWVKQQQGLNAAIELDPFSFQLQRDPQFVDIIRVLDKYSIPISLVFSILWFIDAFITAQRKRDAALKRLYEKKVKNQHESARNLLVETNAAMGTYYRAVLLQVLMLPIGFYILMFHIFQKPNEVDDFLLDEDESIEVSIYNKDGSKDEDSSFSFQTAHCLAVAVLRYLGSEAARITGLRMKHKIKAFTMRTSRRMSLFAIRHPRIFAYRLRMLIKGLRWAKYLAPLIGTSNKLRGNMNDLFKKWRQELAAQTEKRRRMKAWLRRLKSGNRKTLEEEAALIIQRAYRRKQSQKALIVLRLIQNRQRDAAVLRVQAVLRRKVAQARLRLAKKRKELQELERKHESEKKDKKTRLSMEERVKMHELKDELQEEANDLINRRMLLRPDTPFAVTWKVLFVICVIFEIGQLAFKPVLRQYVDKESGERMDIGKVLNHVLVPRPVKAWPQCGARITQEIGAEKRGILGVFRRIKRRKSQEVFFTDHGTHPWYCNPPFSTAQGIYIGLLQVLIQDFLVFVGIICFMDVFITFFTGELNDKNGTLIPKPFFTRWILPGILLQLLVNPQMETVGAFVGHLIKRIMKIGPVRVFRWAAACFFPAGKFLYHWTATNIWWPLVHNNNNNKRSTRSC